MMLIVRGPGRWLWALGASAPRDSEGRAGVGGVGARAGGLTCQSPQRTERGTLFPDTAPRSLTLPVACRHPARASPRSWLQTQDVRLCPDLLGQRMPVGQDPGDSDSAGFENHRFLLGWMEGHLGSENTPWCTARAGQSQSGSSGRSLA